MTSTTTAQDARGNYLRVRDIVCVPFLAASDRFEIAHKATVLELRPGLARVLVHVPPQMRPAGADGIAATYFYRDIWPL